MDGFASLPLPLLQRVLTLVDGAYVVDVLPHTPRIAKSLFHSLSQVSTGWHGLIEELVQFQERTVLAFHIVRGTNEELRAFEQEINARGDQLRSLTLRLGSDEFIRSFEIFKAREHEQRMDDHVLIDWDTVFTTCSKIQRLDLSGIPMHSKHLQRILEAASLHCRELQALIMPKREWHRGPVTTEWLPTMHVLYRALERWYSYGGRNGKRGLVQLCVPQRITRSNTAETIHELADQYLYAVATYCPDLEYFDGWKDTYQQVDARLLCEELLYCSKAAWLTFCERCRHIRELNWYVLPFIDDFFDVFAAFPKPELKKLTLAGGDHINFNDNAVFGTYYTDGPWVYSAERLNRVFQACPQLEELHVTFQLPPFDDGARQDTVTDGFLVSLAAHCSQLRSLVIAELFDADFYGSMEGVTDRGIVAIAKLPELRDIRIKATSCEGAGIAALLLHAPTEGPARDIKLVVGEDASDGEHRPYCPGFYEILAEAMGILVGKAKDLEGRRFNLRLQGHHRGKQNGALWRGTTTILKDQLALRCPWLHITITERHRQVVFAITTAKALPAFASVVPTTVTETEESDDGWWSLWLMITKWLSGSWYPSDGGAQKTMH